MRSLEKGKRYESTERAIARIAYAYGFSSAPTNIPRRALAQSSSSDSKTAASVALVQGAQNFKTPTQVWGAARKGASTVISFAVFSTRHAIAPALIVKTILSIAEVLGFKDLSVLVSSVGDAESRKRFTRELGNFFRKHPDLIPEDLKQLAASDPDAAYRALLARPDETPEKLPRSIDYLSENSRKTMLGALALFESVGITYTIEPRLSAEPGAESELLFAVEGTDQKGTRVRLATGGRYDEVAKKARGNNAEPAVAMSFEVGSRLDLEELDEEPACFVIHVGDAAKLRAFALLEALWRTEHASGNALMAENLRDQVEKGTKSGAKYLAIIGQREALDGTAIVRSVATQMQVTVSFDKLPHYVSRGKRA